MRETYVCPCGATTTWAGNDKKDDGSADLAAAPTPRDVDGGLPRCPICKGRVS